MSVVLLTGITGFAGSYIAEEILRTTDWDIIGIDRYSYAGRMKNIQHLDQSRIKLVYHDFSRPLPELKADFIIHNGAETHVKNSLGNPTPFVDSNIMGTFNMLEAARIIKPKKFLYVSTDEVFGASVFPHKEDDALMPSNPYAATKAAGEYLIRAYGRTFNVPYLITRTMNLFGKRQHVEKFIPLVESRIKSGHPVEIHTDCNGNSGSRQWIHASDQARALLFLLMGPQINDIYHIAGQQVSNKDVAEKISERMGIPWRPIYVNAYNLYPGHDLHYALDDSKIRDAGWSPALTFEQGLALTV